MGTELMTLANAAARYAFEHDLVVPQPGMNKSEWSKAISDAVEHALDHPKNRYAASLIQADNRFAGQHG